MIKGLRGATIWSEDLNNLLPFYRDRLGVKVGLQTDGFVVLGDPGTAPMLPLGTHSEVRGRNADPARHMVGPGHRRRGRRLEASEGRRRRVCRGSTDYGTFRIATLKDPEGNLIQLLQPLS
jgi:catechol 2,3-dioxygenase-like lactoylglutathione lyase family enzyme